MVSVAHSWVTVRESDPAPFERLFRAEYARVVAVAQRVLGDAHAAEDVAQDVFCQFYHRHQPDASYAAPWLHRAAAHAALNVVRGNKRRQRREQTEALESRRVLTGSSGSLDPQVEAERAEQGREVRAALARMSEKHAAVLALRYSGLSYAETATALGVGVGQIGTMLRRAEDALRKELTREASR